MTDAAVSARPSAKFQIPVGSPSPWAQLLELCHKELLNWRWGWRPLVLTGIIVPVIFMTLLGNVASPQADTDRLAHILCGNLIIALMFTNMRRMASRFAWMRDMGTLDYYATLPVQRWLIVVAVLAAFFLLSLPAHVVTLVYGVIFLQVALQRHPLFFVVLPLTALALAGLGAYIGVAARTSEEAQTYSQACLFLCMALGAVLMPQGSLPGGLRLAGWFNPATYGASALRQTLLGPITWQLGLDLVLLAGVSALFLSLVHRKMAWPDRLFSRAYARRKDHRQAVVLGSMLAPVSIFSGFRALPRTPPDRLRADPMQPLKSVPYAFRYNPLS